MYNSFGLWVYDPQFGRHCFLPFGYGWSSPYGYGFGTDIWWYRLPQAVYYPPVYRTPVAGTPPTGGTNPPVGTPPRQNPPAGTPPGDRRPIGGRKREPIGDREPASPPFVRMQGSGRSTGRDSGGFEGPSRGGNQPGGGEFRRPSPSSEPAQRAPVFSPRLEPRDPVNSGGGGGIAPIRRSKDN